MVKSFLVLLFSLLGLSMVRAGEPVFVEAAISDPSPLVQQELRYTLRAYRDSPTIQAYFLAPEIPGAVLEMLGEDDPVWLDKDGRPMQMIERRYALFPQQSGELRLPPPVFSGREVFAQGPSLSLKVRPPLDSKAEWWLPANSLTIEEEFKLPPEIKAGTPLERRLTVTAIGLTGPQLPPLPLARPEGWRSHLMNVETETRIDGERVTGRRIERHLLVPGQGGPAELPEIVLRWWNLESAKAEEAVLPGRRLEVVATVHRVEAEKTAQSGEKPAPPSGNEWAGVPKWLGVPLLAVMVGLWLLFHRLFDRDERARELAGMVLEFREASAKGDLAAARSALLAWGGRAYGRAVPLNELGGLLGDAKAAEALRLLDEISYGGGGTWHIQRGEAIAAALRRAGTRPADSRSGGLPGL